MRDIEVTHKTGHPFSRTLNVRVGALHLAVLQLSGEQHRHESYGATVRRIIEEHADRFVDEHGTTLLEHLAEHHDPAEIDGDWRERRRRR